MIMSSTGTVNQRQHDRKMSFKKGICKSGARRLREEKNISIRKLKRREQMQKRRKPWIRFQQSRANEFELAAMWDKEPMPNPMLDVEVQPIPTVADVPNLFAGQPRSSCPFGVSPPGYPAAFLPTLQGCTAPT